MTLHGTSIILGREVSFIGMTLHSIFIILGREVSSIGMTLYSTFSFQGTLNVLGSEIKCQVQVALPRSFNLTGSFPAMTLGRLSEEESEEGVIELSGSGSMDTGPLLKITFDKEVVRRKYQPFNHSTNNTSLVYI